MPDKNLYFWKKFKPLKLISQYFHSIQRHRNSSGWICTG